MPGLADVPVLTNRAALARLVTRAVDEGWTTQRLAEESGVSRATAGVALSARVSTIVQSEARRSLEIGDRVWNALGDTASRRVRLLERLNRQDTESMTAEDIRMENAAVNGLRTLLDLLDRFGPKAENERRKVPSMEVGV